MHATGFFFYYFSLIPYTSVHMEKYQLNQSIQLAIRSLNLASSSEQHYYLFIFPTTDLHAVFSTTTYYLLLTTYLQPLTCNWKCEKFHYHSPTHSTTYLVGFIFNGFGKMKTKVNFSVIFFYYTKIKKKLAREIIIIIKLN